MKLFYYDEAFKPYFSIYMSLYPNLWTPCEALRMQKILLPLVLSFVLFLFDVTVDRLPENPEDPLRVLNQITSKQDALITKGLQILERVRSEMKLRELSASGPIPCKAEIEELQEELFRFNNDDIFPVVGELNDTDTLKKSSEGLIKRLFKGILTALMLVSLLSFVLFGHSPKHSKLLKH